MNKIVFYFYTDPNSHFHLIFKCDSKIDNKKFKKRVIDSIAVKVFDKFLGKFKEELVNFNGSFTQFKSFSTDLSEIIKPKGLLRDYSLHPEAF